MHQLRAVEEAKAVLTEGQGWSIWRWLAEKRRVRAMADRGTAALDELERQVKSTWSDELKNAYAMLSAPLDDDPFAAAEIEFAAQESHGIAEPIRSAARRTKEADDAAYRARMTAEATFERAESRLSTALAKQGAREAIEAYALRYRAIAEAEAARTACARGTAAGPGE